MTKEKLSALFEQFGGKDGKISDQNLKAAFSRLGQSLTSEEAHEIIRTHSTKLEMNTIDFNGFE